MIDVGANVGSFARLAAQMLGPAGRVIALEPVPSVGTEWNELLMTHKKQLSCSSEQEQAGIVKQEQAGFVGSRSKLALLSKSKLALLAGASWHCWQEQAGIIEQEQAGIVGCWQQEQAGIVGCEQQEQAGIVGAEGMLDSTLRLVLCMFVILCVCVCTVSRMIGSAILYNETFEL